jgi:two-component system chemotaxis sensor kinase CheA
LTRAARDLARAVNDLAKEWSRLRTNCGSQLHRLASDPEFRRFSRLLEGFERRLRQAPRHARRLLLEQQRCATDARLLASQLRIDVWQARLTPAESVFDGFGNMVRSLARTENKEIRFRTIGLDTEADREVLQSLRDPVMHLLRNAVSHGIESPLERQEAGKPPAGQVTLSLEAAAGRLTVRVSDDGRGIDFGRVAGEARRRGLLSEQAPAAEQDEILRQIIFAPGFSTAAAVSEIAGRGMGLSVVDQSVRRLQGEIETLSEPGGGTAVVIHAPLSVLMQRVLLVTAAGRVYAIPLRSVERAGRGSPDLMETVANQLYVRLNGEPVRAVSLAALLGLAQSAAGHDAPFLIVRNGAKRVAFFVDELLEEREALVKDLNIPETHGTLAAGGVLLENRTVAVALNVPKLLRASESAAPAGPPQPAPGALEKRKHRILLADDSITTRALERSILEVHGYEVLAAVDGVEALQMLRSQGADLVISDVQMPRLDGFGLLLAIKSEERLAGIPVIILTSMETPKEQERGLALGADAYIMKRKFDQRELLETIRQIL